MEEGERGKSGRVEILRVCEGGNGINPQQGEWIMRDKEGGNPTAVLAEIGIFFFIIIIFNSIEGQFIQN